MSIWSIVQMEDYVSHAGKDRVIFNLHWRYSDESGDYSASNIGTQSLEPMGDLDPFTPWENVTEEQALEWLHDRLGVSGVSEIESNVSKILDSKLNPTRGSGVPWK